MQEQQKWKNFLLDTRITIWALEYGEENWTHNCMYTIFQISAVFDK